MTIVAEELVARFPEDFIFQLMARETAEVVTNCDHLTNLKFSSSLPSALTEYGALLAERLPRSK